MSRRRHAYLAASLMTGLLALPSIAAAATGGTGLGILDGVPLATATQPGNVTVTASGNGISFSTRASAMLRGSLHFSGAVAAAAGDTIEIERKGAETNWSWAPTTHATVGSSGSFNAVWRANHIGRFSIRAVISGGAHAASASPSLNVTVYRPSIATWYGDKNMWGTRTACGEVLRPTTIGVANRTLPCGTSVALYYGGRTMVVPVIDRGPYANGADWDLTLATANALGTTSIGVATIGAVSLPKAP